MTEVNISAIVVVKKYVLFFTMGVLMGAEISFLEGFIPSQLAFINTLIFVSLICGFIVIVTTNKKHRYLFDYIERFF